MGWENHETGQRHRKPLARKLFHRSQNHFAQSHSLGERERGREGGRERGREGGREGGGGGGMENKQFPSQLTMNVSLYIYIYL